MALLAYLYIAPFLPSDVPVHERAFQSQLRTGMRRSDVIAAAKLTGGQDPSGDNWNYVPGPGEKNIVIVGFGIRSGFGQSHWKDYWLTFDRSDRLKSWYTGQHDSAL